MSTTSTEAWTDETPPQINRDRWGRPLVIPETGGKPVAYTRCTTFVGCLEDTYNLGRWQQRMVALGLADRPDLMLSVTAHREDKRELDRICSDAQEAARAHAAATTGTALHALCERLDKGQEVGVVPDEYLADLAAYQEATAPLTCLEIERFCVLDRYKIGGTPDRVVKYGKKRYIADIKTGQITYGIGKIAMQMAVYARSKLYDIETGKRSMHDADLTKALIIHLPAGKGECALYWVDIKTAWDRGVSYAKHVRDWRALKFVDLAEPFTTDEPEPVEPTLEQQINACTDADAVRVLWAANASQWTNAHTKIARTHIAALDSK